MFATPAILALLFFVYIRPQEIVPALNRVPLLYLLVGLSLTGLALDLRLGMSRLRNNPLFPWAVAHLLWNFVSMAVAARHAIPEYGISLVVAFIIFLVLSQGVQSFRALSAIGVGLYAITMVIGFVGLHQSFAPLECVHPSEENPEVLAPLGGACLTSEQCQAMHDRDDASCERIGLLGTTSVGQRVRYRGLMQDPNELALMGSMAIAFAFALFELRRSLGRFLLAGGTLLVIGIVDVYTRSRSGQLAFLTILGVYFLRRLRWLGAVVAGVMALPILMLGGRGGEEAAESSGVRLGYWAAAIQMARESPLWGVGMAQFTEYQPQTAHSSIMLVLGESGLPGLFFWTGLMYVAIKVPLMVLWDERAPQAKPAQVWATALLACLAGFSVSSLFLSLTYHYVLWVLLGLVGALYGATTRHDRTFSVRFGWKDFLLVGAIDSFLVIAIHFYTRAKGF